MTSPSSDFPGQAAEPRTDGPTAVPSGGEFTTAWVAYGCYFFGVILWWPSIIGLIISYVRRDEPGAGFIASHYRWLIGTFWWSTFGWIASIALIVAGALPIVLDVVRSLRASGKRLGDIEVDTLISIDWSSVLTAAGMATLGAIGLLCVYLWLLYRLIRGALRLADGRPAP